MDKTVEDTWREGFLKPEALVVPKINNLYGRKSAHIIDKIQRMLKINRIAIVVGTPIMWVLLELSGIPYTGAILWSVLTGLVVVEQVWGTRFEPPQTSLDSYQYLKAFNAWLKNRMERSKKIQRHFYAVCVLAVMVGVLASTGGQELVRLLVEGNPGLQLVNGIPLLVIVVVAGVTIAVELLGGVIFDFDVNIVYRAVFRKLDQMVAEMEELRS